MLILARGRKSRLVEHRVLGAIYEGEELLARVLGGSGKGGYIK